MYHPQNTEAKDMGERKIKQVRTRRAGSGRTRIISLTPKALASLERRSQLVIMDAASYLVSWHTDRNSAPYTLDSDLSDKILEMLGAKDLNHYQKVSSAILDKEVKNWRKYLETEKEILSWEPDNFEDFVIRLTNLYESTF